MTEQTLFKKSRQNITKPGTAKNLTSPNKYARGFHGSPSGRGKFARHKFTFARLCLFQQFHNLWISRFISQYQILYYSKRTDFRGKIVKCQEIALISSWTKYLYKKEIAVTHF